MSEGGFAPNRVSAASLLDISTEADKKGKNYYKYEILTRTGKLCSTCVMYHCFLSIDLCWSEHPKDVDVEMSCKHLY